MDLVLPMGCVSSPPFLCAAVETAEDLSNGDMADNCSFTQEYGPTSGTYLIVPTHPAYEERFQATDIYMSDLNCLAQGSPAQQRRVTEMVLQGIKDICPSLLTKIKDSISLKKAREGDEYWAE